MVAAKKLLTKANLTRTAEEQQVIDAIAKDKGKDWTDEHAHLILEQARALGEL